MAGQQPVDRRTALQALGAAATLAGGVPVAGATAADGDRSSDEDVGSNLMGFYTGTVDRVVDGEHVVILVEEDGSVIAQEVVPASQYPFLGEGDPVGLYYLWGWLVAVWPLD